MIVLWFNGFDVKNTISFFFFYQKKNILTSLDILKDTFELLFMVNKN